jgi:hypothetical protein
MEADLFAALAERIFIDDAPLWCGPTLAAALHTDIIEAKAVKIQPMREELPDNDAPFEEELSHWEGEPGDEHFDNDEPGEAPDGHHDWEPDPARNLPNPKKLPHNDGKPSARKTGQGQKERKDGRPAIPGEETQIRALKQDHYAYHCQISLATQAPRRLAPKGSYAELAENRSKIIDAHHPDYAGAAGARHAGNLLILSHVEHHRIGRRLSREQIRDALKVARPHEVVFGDSESSRTVDGVIADVLVPSTGEVIPIFFTLEHRDYWLR